MRSFFVLIGVLVFLQSCTNNEKEKVAISNIEVTLNIERFEERFYASNATTLLKLKKDFPFLFPEQTPDSIWLQRIQSEDEQLLFKKSQKVFGDFQVEAAQLEQLFKYFKYYYPNFSAPKIITLITDLDYQSSVIYTGEFLFISLDMYLGANDEVYQNFPNYLAQNFKKERIVVDVANELAKNVTKTKIRSRQFIDIMVDEGKKMYFISSLLPKVSEHLVMGYPLDKMNWARENEQEIWRYFIENKLLYSTDSNLYKRFIANSPFSKFYMDIEKESPGKIGVWMGWQIVKSFMKNNDVPLQQMLAIDAQEIFKQSKYKPKK